MGAALSAEAEERRKRSAAAEHIAVEASRLARMANAHGLSMLAYLIEMAVLEAWREASEPGSGDGRARGGNSGTES
jgi:hypothetical protein